MEQPRGWHTASLGFDSRAIDYSSSTQPQGYKSLIFVHTNLTQILSFWMEKSSWKVWARWGGVLIIAVVPLVWFHSAGLALFNDLVPKVS